MESKGNLLRVEVKLTKDFAVVVEGTYTAAHDYFRYNTPTESAEFGVKSVYDKKGKDITALFECFDNHLTDQIEKVKKETKCNQFYQAEDVWMWLGEKALDVINLKEEMEKKLSEK